MATTARFRLIRLAGDDDIAAQLVRPMKNLGNAVGRRMQRLVPKAEWRLHDSIQAPEVERKGGKVITTIRFGGKRVGGVMVNYHLMVERGTSRMAAQPYARPAILQTKSADLKYEGVMADRHGTRAERRAYNAAARHSRRAEHEGES